MSMGFPAGIDGSRPATFDVDAASGKAETPPAPTAVQTLPPPTDPLDTMHCSGDIGEQIAILVMLTKKEERDRARAGREAADTAADAAQRDELEHMKDAADARLVGGIVQGSMQLGSAGASFTSAAQGARATSLNEQNRLHPDAGSIGRERDLQTSAGAWSGVAKGAEGGATIASAVGNFVGSREDQGAKEAANRAEHAKRTAEEYNDAVKDADGSLKNCLNFVGEWINATNAARAAAIHRA